MELLDAVGALPGVGPKKTEALARLGIVTLLDLLSYYPRSYIDQSTDNTVPLFADSDMTMKTLTADHQEEIVGTGVLSLYNDRIDLARLKAFCRGYFSAMSDAPTSKEIFLGLVCVTAELSVAFGSADSSVCAAASSLAWDSSFF